MSYTIYKVTGSAPLPRVGVRSRSTIMMVPYSPEGMNLAADQITQALLTAKQADRAAVADARKAAQHKVGSG